MTLSGDSLRLGTSEGRAVTTPVQHRSGSPATAARHGKQREGVVSKREMKLSLQMACMSG